jgi:hypothetical protein
VEVVLQIVCAIFIPYAAGVDSFSNAVDILNLTSGVWSTAVLSVARGQFSATSLPNAGLAIFAGGYSTCVDAMLFSTIFVCCVVVILDSDLEWARVALQIAFAVLMPCAVSGNSFSNAVDMFNATSGAWSTAALSAARVNLAATSLPNVGLAIIAGGNSA